MTQYLALVRGINVGGIVLKMTDLKSLLEKIGLTNIRTYIQSGNVVFESKERDVHALEKIVMDAILRDKHISVAVNVKTRAQLEKIAAAHPFASKGNDKTLYVTVLNSKPAKPRIDEFMGGDYAPDCFVIRNDIVYGCYPQGYGKSKFTNNYIESKLQVSGTTRNWNTIQKLLAMMQSG
jgi:uncharacterized protein (DUF1697 family)